MVSEQIRDDECFTVFSGDQEATPRASLFNFVVTRVRAGEIAKELRARGGYECMTQYLIPIGTFGSQLIAGDDALRQAARNFLTTGEITISMKNDESFLFTRLSECLQIAVLLKS